MTEGLGGIRPTEIERLMGRLMRAPDHDGAGDTGSEGGDATAGDGGATDATAGDTNSEATGGATDGEQGNATTLVGEAATKTGAGKDSETGESDKGESDGAKDDVKAEVPEAYDLKLTIGEGDDAKAIDMDPVLVEAATPILKELELTNDQANKLVGIVPKVQEQVVKGLTDDFEKQSAAWAKEAKADPDIGGKNWTETEHLMGKALDKFGSDGLTELVNQSRIGNHPDFVRFVRSVGKAMSEDSEFPRGNPAAEKVDSAAILYPDDVPKTAAK